jgi:hypothetical protein
MNVQTEKKEKVESLGQLLFFQEERSINPCLNLQLF